MEFKISGRLDQGSSEASEGLGHFQRRMPRERSKIIVHCHSKKANTSCQSEREFCLVKESS